MTFPGRPPNIDEIGNVVLLRQAVDVLAASEEVQRALYPPGRDPSVEMAILFEDAWARVRPVFEPILPVGTLGDLLAISDALARRPVDWEAVRTRAGSARAALPGLRDRGPRAWHEQMVRGRNRLLLRSQLMEGP